LEPWIVWHHLDSEHLSPISFVNPHDTASNGQRTLHDEIEWFVDLEHDLAAYQ
jgi:hypothetical protein